jgi:hypothetical protein
MQDTNIAAAQPATEQIPTTKSPQGYDRIARCSQGHLFTTIWIPLISLKAFRLGNQRLQRCPVGQHWVLVRPVRDEDLTDDERREAAVHHNVRLP